MFTNTTTAFNYRHFSVVSYTNGGHLPHTLVTYKVQVYRWDGSRMGTYKTIREAEEHIDRFWDAFEAQYVAAEKAKLGA